MSKFVLNARTTGFIEMAKDVFQYLLTVKSGMKMENALPATRDTTSPTVPAFWLIKKAQLTSDARDGIGTTKNVLNALPDGLSIPTESANQSMMPAQPGELTENALPATRDTTSPTVPAFWLIKKAQLTSDARDGIGTTKNVLNALPDGLSIPTESANQSTTIALHGEHMENAQLVTQDMLSTKENVKL